MRRAACAVRAAADPQAPRSYSPDQRWAEPDVRDGAPRLREVLADPQAARARGRELQAGVRARFGDEAVIGRLAAVLAAAAESPAGTARARPPADAHRPPTAS